MIEGIYALQEWWIDGELHRPPQVDGRFVLREGCIVAILRDRRDALPRQSGTLFGHYRLSADAFAYGYDDALMVGQTAAGFVVGEQAPWSGLREFSVAASGAQTFVRALSGTAEFCFDADGFSYSEEGRVLRRWRRQGG